MGAQATRLQHSVNGISVVTGTDFYLQDSDSVTITSGTIGDLTLDINGAAGGNALPSTTRLSLATQILISLAEMVTLRAQAIPFTGTTRLDTNDTTGGDI